MSAQPRRSDTKTPGQLRCIFGLARKQRIDSDNLHSLVETVTGKSGQPKDSIKALSFFEANEVIKELGGRAFSQSPVAKRTDQYRRARTGAKKLVGQSQIELIATLASQRNWSADALVKFVTRMVKHYPVRTTEEANKVIEALKAMNKRDGLWSGQ